jgi:hypothetical protein
MKNKYNFNIKETGDDISLFCKDCKMQISKRYNRIVIGERGPYVEFEPIDIIHENIIHGKDQNHIFFSEYCSSCSEKIFIYFQRKIVKYADYLVGKFYISPYLLCDKNDIVVLENEENLNFKELFL